MTVVPGFADNAQPVTGCDGRRPTPARPGHELRLPRTAPVRHVAAGHRRRPAPRRAAVDDRASPTSAPAPRPARSSRSPSARATGSASGGSGAWRGSRTPTPRHPVMRAVAGRVVAAQGGPTAVPVYGRAYPEQAAYAGTPVPVPDGRPRCSTRSSRASLRAGRRHDRRPTTTTRRPTTAPRRRTTPSWWAGPLLPDLVRPPDGLRAGGRREAHPLAHPRLVEPTRLVELVETTRAGPRLVELVETTRPPSAGRACRDHPSSPPSAGRACRDHSPSPPHAPARAGACVSQPPSPDGPEEVQEYAPSSLPST